MSDSANNSFDAGAYWQDRVVAGADLGVVGHRSVGPAYNRQIYERRLEVLDEMLSRHVDKPIEDLRVLDIGCGNGFYTDFWAARGVRDYVGIDISRATIEHLAPRFPDYRFLHRDITAAGSESLAELGSFDLITVFDVFYHIVDDECFTSAVHVVASALAPSGIALVMDNLFERRYQLTRHMLYRDRGRYLDVFDAQQLQLVDSELLFHYLIPPVTGNFVIDYASAGAFKIGGFALRLSESLASRVAAALRRRDANLRDQGKRVSNSEFLVFRKAAR
jgi:SAM-dependent methyltransferase